MPPTRSTGMGSVWGIDPNDPEHYVLRHRSGLPGPLFKRKRNVVRVKKTVKECMNELLELKHTTTAISASPVATTGNFFHCAILSQGTSAVTRVGQSIHARMLDVNLEFLLAAGAATDNIRVIIGLDRMPDGAAPAVTDILESSTPRSPLNMDKVDHLGHKFRFKLLADTNLELAGYAATVVTRTLVRRWRFKLNHKILYQSNAGTISDLMRNNIFVLTISEDAIAGLDGTAQLCYTDG